MKIEELIAKLKEEGKNEEEIKAELELVKKDIDAYLGDDEVEEEVKKDEEESEEDKRKRIFGI